MTQTIEKAYKDIIKAIGEDLNRPGLADTPKRAAKAMEFLMRGYSQNIDEVINDALFPSSAEEMVIVKKEIAETIVNKTGATGAGVIIEAQHMCMMMRGVEKQNSIMTTSCMLGAFRNSQSTRNEFLSLISK